MDEWKEIVLGVLITAFCFVGLISTLYIILSAFGVYG